MNLGLCDLFTGKTDEAMAVIEALAQDTPSSPYSQQTLGYAYGVTGRAAEAKKVLAQLEELGRTRYVPPSAYAYIYAGLGRKDAALDWLEKACAERDTEMIFLRLDLAFASLRGEPRFQALLKKVGPSK